MFHRTSIVLDRPSALVVAAIKCSLRSGLSGFFRKWERACRRELHVRVQQRTTVAGAQGRPYAA